MGNSSTCTSTANYCYAGQFCPATSGTEVFCKFCSTGVTPGQGCSCKRYHEIKGCSKCDGDDCVECLPGHFLQENTCQQCAKGCELCDSIYVCTKCQEQYIFDTISQDCIPACITNDDCKIPQGYFCNQFSSRCEACDEFCLVCISTDVCISCLQKEDLLTIDGSCIAGCGTLKNGQYCLYDSPTPCVEDISTQCKCGSAINCATCTKDGTTCDKCLTTFQKDNSGRCQLCIEGYESKGYLCVPRAITLQESGTCSVANNGCKAGYFCPSTGSYSVQCVPCNNDMIFGQSCYCADNTPTKNCVECANGKCTHVLLEKDGQKVPHTKCLHACFECDENQKCLRCVQAHTLNKDTNTCHNACVHNIDCAQARGSFCNIPTRRCTPCPTGCIYCQSKDFCLICDKSNFVTTIAGICEPMCGNLETGQYCNDGKADTCGIYISSECKCGKAMNCSTCKEDGVSCATCLSGTSMDHYGICYKIIPHGLAQQQLIKTEIVESSGVQLGVGAAIGVIFTLVVLTGSVGAILYAILKKRNKAAVAVDTATN
eukprot:EST47317.1 Cysteine-rich membrane protein 2 [Spironucleus salmonicida]